MDELNRAFRSTQAIVAKVQPGDLDAPTPCASWDVRRSGCRSGSSPELPC